jgi:phage-related protein
MQKFTTIFLEEAREFLKGLSEKARDKIIYNIDKAEQLNDPKLFKKLNGEIWEFRTNYQGLQYRLLAFWDKTNNRQTLVICTRGIVKKQDKMPKGETAKAEQIRTGYFENL